MRNPMESPDGCCIITLIAAICRERVDISGIRAPAPVLCHLALLYLVRLHLVAV